MLKNWLIPQGAGNPIGGLQFCGCGLRTMMPTGDEAGISLRRPPVMIKGKRARTVDVHAHCFFQSAIDLMGDEAPSVIPPVKGVPEHFIDIPSRLSAMDRMGIDMQVLSINP